MSRRRRRYLSDPVWTRQDFRSFVIVPSARFSMSAIQDFAMQLRTNHARTLVPQPIDPEVFRRALETLDISALFTPPTSVPTSLAVPPPDLAMHVQPEPKVEPEVDPVVESEVEHIMEPTANVESHYPSADVLSVVGESIVVVERYVATI
ncbi:hypothetical protein R1sor_022202 [Riccia sorocarpa]|uniref:Uncharacterized protein n=1 Tax=Riccia sorocarpa TaxID=122646 RepID=A0ABD3GKX3_9MARC